VDKLGIDVFSGKTEASEDHVFIRSLKEDPKSIVKGSSYADGDRFACGNHCGLGCLER
jgi:hypothetical protein